MGFREDRAQMLQALRSGRVFHEQRSYFEDKNVLATGQISEQEALVLLAAVRGSQAEVSVHHYDPLQKVWILKPEVAGVRWYLKAYLQDDCLVFLSFHRAQGGA